MKHAVSKNLLKMERDIGKVIEEKRACKVMRVTKFSTGSMNHVFKVETDREIVVARIFAKKDFPDCNKLLWIDRTLRKNNIETAKILYCTKDPVPFRYGFMLTEYVEGVDGWTALREGACSLQNYFLQLGELMRRVHAVKISGKSPFKTHPPKGGERWFEKVVGRLASQGDLSEGICRCIQEFVTQTFVAFSPRLKNVLCHCDVGPQNHIYTPDGRIFLLDWDLAERGNLFRDFAVVLLDVKEMARLGKVAEVRQSIQRAFLRGYGEMGFTPQEIERLIDAHHVICLVYNTLAFLETEKNSKQEKRNMAQIRKILQKYS